MTIKKKNYTNFLEQFIFVHIYLKSDNSFIFIIKGQF